MDKSKKRWLIILGVGLLIGLILIGIFMGMLSRRGKALNSRPLVLIIDPDYGDEVQVGDGVIVHATAREDVGLTRMELWINDELIDSRDADVLEGSAPTNLTLISTWLPTFEGEQQIIVRAISVDDVAGQSMVQLSVGAADELTHLVVEGETLESIAEDYGSSAEELSDRNPGLGGGDPIPGDEIIIPDDDPGRGGASGSGEDSGGEPPETEGEEPLLSLGFQLFDFLSLDDENVTLRLEVPGLRTWESFDNLHCYVSLADSLPQWYPDFDNNQATDDSFEAGVNGWWVTDGILVGSAAPIISWPADQPLPLSVACVGVSGGTQALELGVIALEIPNDEWDGIRHGYESDGEGGHLFMDIKVTELEGDPRNTPKYPDPDMTKPTNVRLNEEEHTLEWDFEAAEGEEISGFRIYLNENLQWAVPADARSTRLPPEWFRPPCAWTYTFGVTAYLIDFPDGPESDPPSTVDLVQPREGCMRIMRVTFLELETFDLGDDGRYERRHGDVGPAYGTFYANDSRVSFDHGHEGSGLDMVEGLSHNTTYDLAVVSGDIGWHFSGSNSIITEVPFEGEMYVGFLIMDRDNNPDDEICEGFHYPIRDAWGQLDGYHRESMTSENGRCRVTFEFEPTPDSPVGERYDGAEPLPWLEIVGLDVYSNPDETIVAVSNTGTASWPGRTLSLELQTRDGHSLGHFMFDDVTIPTGEVETFRIPRTTPEPLIDVCVLVDSLDEVLELYERSGALIHHPYCTDLPDVMVNDVVYSDTEQILRVYVDNIGDGPVANWPLSANITLPDGAVLVADHRVPDLALPAGRSFILAIPLDEDQRARMIDGYTVSLNPGEEFPESNFDNNDRVIPEGTELSMSWYGMESPESLKDIVEFHIDAFILQGRDRKEHIVDWNMTQDIDWGSCFSDDYCILLLNHSDHGYDYFSDSHIIYGDESLELVVEVTHPGSLWTNYSVTEIYDSPHWEAGGDSPSGGCYFWPMRDDVGRHGFLFTDEGGREWYTRVDICRENFSE